MKSRNFLKAIQYMLAMWLILWSGGILYGQVISPALPPPDVQYMGPHGEVVNGIRCATSPQSLEQVQGIQQQLERWLQAGNRVISTYRWLFISCGMMMDRLM